MNWDYIAGFFDGEGCIHFSVGAAGGGKGRVQLTLVQTATEGEKLLKEIKEFIALYGISSRVDFEDRTHINPRHTRCWRLWVLGWDQALLFLSFIYPKLRIKKLMAQDVWRFHKVYPYIPKKAQAMLRWESRRRNARFRPLPAPTQ